MAVAWEKFSNFFEDLIGLRLKHYGIYMTVAFLQMYFYHIANNGYDFMTLANISSKMLFHPYLNSCRPNMSFSFEQVKDG